MAAMIFMFLGVSIISDRFMASIEVITSKEREVTIRLANGEKTVVNVRIWNETVSNLTLMALGSSAPEILLSIIEIIGNKFEAGQLGPSTIVGSAAYNLFVIIGICVYVIPDGEIRRIKHLGVFFITATWSIFAYLWLYIILAVISEGVIEVWEAVLTFLFFPATVATAYFADRKIFFMKFLNKKYHATSNYPRKSIQSADGDLELAERNHVGNGTNEEGMTFKSLDGQDDGEAKEFEKHRRDFIEILRETRKRHPNLDMKSLEEMAEMECMNRGPKSRAFYRIQATRKLTGGGKVIKKAKFDRKSSLDEIKLEEVDETITRVFFEPGHYTVMENVGTFNITVSRAGGDMNRCLDVSYVTEDGTANAGADYVFASGVLKFQPGEAHKQFSLTILDDDIFEEDEHFYVRLDNLVIPDAYTDDISKMAVLSTPFLATVMILDDDHSGIFHFEAPTQSISESVGELEIKVLRSSGARGKVMVPFKTIEGTAKGGGKDFFDEESYLIFENDQVEQVIKVRIIDDEEYEKNESFFIEIGEPQLLKKDSGSGRRDSAIELESLHEDAIAQLGKPRLGDVSKIEVQIRESMEFKSTVDKLLKKTNVALVVGTSSWREQFVEAITISAGDDDNGQEDDEEEKLPSCMDYVMHFLTIFWKVLFAFVPPTDYWGGWLSFTTAIMVIGLLTALIGDLASSFGCTIGMKDSVTAISFVALGTSLPDTFASKVAAIGDENADSSIANVTGSNAVNVFLGIGIAWTIAAVKHAINNKPFKVDIGSLAFSVTIFCAFGLVAIAMLMIRRMKRVAGGELGGSNKNLKKLTACMFVSLWVLYVILSSLESYCHIKGF